MKIFGMILPFWSSIRQRKHEKKPKSFDEYVVRDILTDNSFGISEVRNLKSLKSMYLERGNYPLIESLLRAHNLSELMKMSVGNVHPTFSEYLEIMQFEDQNRDKFIATVYDSIGLWQNPEIIDIFRLNLGPTSD